MKGDLHRAISEEVQTIFAEMHCDPFLHTMFAEVIEHIVSSAGAVLIRFQIYREYPARVVLLSSEWNAHGWQLEALDFLKRSEEELDESFSLPPPPPSLELGIRAARDVLSRKRRDAGDDRGSRGGR